MFRLYYAVCRLVSALEQAFPERVLLSTGILGWAQWFRPSWRQPCALSCLDDHEILAYHNHPVLAAQSLETDREAHKGLRVL